MADQPQEPSVLAEIRGHRGLVPLNRPRAVNALNVEMIQLINRALDEFEADANVTCVAVVGSGDRGLCAGGDIRALYDAAKSGDESLAKAFWSEEYRLNAALASYPKPVVGLMDGICMGGGVSNADDDLLLDPVRELVRQGSYGGTVAAVGRAGSRRLDLGL